MSKRIFKPLLAAVAASYLSIAGGSIAQENITSSPIGFNKVMLFMGTGVIDPSITSPRPGVTGCGGGALCDGNHFQRTIMGRDDAQIAAKEQEAKDHFGVEYGVDIDELVAAGRIVFTDFSLNPDYQYRLFMADGVGPNSDGWLIRDGGFLAIVVDPQGIELGGNHVGVTARASFVFMYGEYNILKTNSEGLPMEEMIIHFRSTTPAIIREDGSLDFRCSLFHEQWGEGTAHGTTVLDPILGGKLRGNGRTVVTFPASSAASRFPAFPNFSYDGSALQ